MTNETKRDAMLGGVNVYVTQEERLNIKLTPPLRE